MIFSEWQDAISEASQPGDVFSPDALLRNIGAIAEPANVFGDMDVTNGLFAALHNEYPFFRVYRHNEAFPEPERVRGVGVLRWLIEEFRTWSLAKDPMLARFVALVVVVQSCPWDSTSWFLLDDKLLFNAELVARLRQVLSKITINFSINDARGDVRAQQRTEAQIKSAELSSDWKTLLEIWRRTTQFLSQTPIIVQAVRYLYRHDSSQLVEGTAGIQSVVLAQQVVASLTAAQAFEFANQSTNRLIQLMAIQTALGARPRYQTFLNEEENALVALLHSIAADEQTWPTFVALYNEHPSIYPALQPAIGQVLASAQEAALGAYVDSIFLSVPCNMGDRKEVTTCLTIFRVSADEERQHKLWAKAFQRWSAWNFNAVDGSFPAPTLSVLDYAIVGYLKEYEKEDECREELKLIEEQLARLEGRWFPTITDLYNEYRRLMSRYQPYAHALDASSEGQSLLEKPSYQVAEASPLYSFLRFRINEISLTIS